MSDEELDVKVGTKEEAAWTQLKDSFEKEIAHNRRVTEIDKAAIEVCKKHIAAEQDKKS